MQAAKMDDRFVLSHPLTNSTFKHWRASGNSVFLENKAILVPELVGSYGLIYGKHTFNLPDFEVQIDLSIHNKLKSSFVMSDFRLYILRDNPMKSAFEYGQGLSDSFDGMMIHIEANKLKNKNRLSDEDAYRLHSIIPYVRDEEF